MVKSSMTMEEKNMCLEFPSKYIHETWNSPGNELRHAKQKLNLAISWIVIKIYIDHNQNVTSISAKKNNSYSL